MLCSEIVFAVISEVRCVATPIHIYNVPLYEYSTLNAVLAHIHQWYIDFYPWDIIGASQHKHTFHMTLLAICAGNPLVTS